MTAPEPADWLSLTREDPVDPRRRIVDAHHHLYTEADPLQGTPRYLVDDLLRDTGAGHNVTETVFVECRAGYRQDGPEALRPVGETEFAVAQAEASKESATRIAAIVGFADLTLGDAVDEVLQAHEMAGRGRFRGIRHRVATDPGIRRPNAPPRGLLADERFRRGLARMGDLGYSFDAWMFHPQLAELADAAEAIPETTFVVEHLGAPLHCGPYLDRDDVREVWQRGIGQVAACPNVVIKIGGIGMESLFGTDWSSRQRPPTSDEVVARWGGEVRRCIDTFGPSRCMFESNFPVDRRAVGYTVLWNAFQKMAAAYSDGEQDALFAATAVRVYRIAGQEAGAFPADEQASGLRDERPDRPA
jgi:predicted TIM-barrel fold metal-dependent hydrolase